MRWEAERRGFINNGLNNNRQSQPVREVVSHRLPNAQKVTHARAKYIIFHKEAKLVHVSIIYDRVSLGRRRVQLEIFVFVVLV